MSITSDGTGEIREDGGQRRATDRTRPDDHVLGVLICWGILLGIYGVLYALVSAESSAYLIGSSPVNGFLEGALNLAVTGFIVLLITGAGMLFVGVPISLLVERLLRPLSAVTAGAMLVRTLVYLCAGWLAGAVIIPAVLLLVFSGVGAVGGVADGLSWTTLYVGAPAAVAAATARLLIDLRVRGRRQRAERVRSAR